jgi:alpha-L-rhamnosidase
LGAGIDGVFAVKFSQSVSDEFGKVMVTKWMIWSLLMGTVSANVAVAVTVGQLRCEYLRNPLGIGETSPRLSWIIESDRRREIQTAYQILVASTAELLAADKGDLWDSGKIPSDDSAQVRYAGQTLQSQTRCFWKVRLWDRHGEPSAWSQAASWSMGLLKPEDWQAEWIGADEQAPSDVSLWLRKAFVLEEKPSRGWACLNLIGYGELYVNGEKAGTDVLTPAATDYREGVPYVTYDIAPLLKQGRNCVAVWLGRGWATHFPDGLKSRQTPSPAVRLQCVLSGANDARQIVTDGTWKVAPSPYRTLGTQEWNQFGGESYDARLEQPAWNRAGFNDARWALAQVLPLSVPRAIEQIAPLNRLSTPMAAKSVTDLGGGCYEIDFGTNLSGWMELRIPAVPAGQKVVIAYADLRTASEGSNRPGQLEWPPVLGAPAAPHRWLYQHFNQNDEFISNGRPGVFCSKFNYHGFRYAVVKGLPASPALGDVSARLIDADVDSRGAFECSNPLLNRIHALHVWTARCLNLGGYMVDCPHRERLGYGDGQVSAETCLYNFDYGAFYTKWLGDWRAARIKQTGEVPHAAPRWGGGGGPGWGGSLAALTWRLYLFNGDRRILERNYDAMRGHLDFLESKCKNNLLRSFGGAWDFIGDWVPPGRGMDAPKNWPGVPARELFNNCCRVYLWQLQQQAAVALGRKDDAARCQAKLEEIRPAIHAAFFDAEKHQYVIGEQAYQLMPLFAGVVPESERAAVLKNLEDNILVKNKGHLDTGMLGTYFLVQYLSQIGRNDLLYTIANQKTYPGWGYMAEQGATTLWEQWNGFWSRIHSCFVSLDGWFYEGLAGIRPEATAPGFKKIVIKPQVVGDLTWVSAHYDSPYGRIVSNWSREGSRLTMEVTIPVNTTATVHIPTKNAAGLTESGQPADKVEGVKFLHTQDNAAVYAVGSGTYLFQSTLP